LAAVEPRTRRIVHWLLDPLSGEPWGVAEAVAASFDLEARKLIELSPAALARLRRHVAPGLTL
jgi:acyl-CoA thioester hydrolase